MVKIDLKDTYFTIPIDPLHRPLLCFQHRWATSIQLPSLWSCISTPSVHQDIKTNRNLAQATRLSNDQLHRRQPTNSQLERGGSINGRTDSNTHGKTGFHSEQGQISA
uniref:Uncharacterized protein n=1 Tax=Amphimedon queenslandica TaxID=400682 RepID=A0A1X7USN3_AMPQE